MLKLIELRVRAGGEHAAYVERWTAALATWAERPAGERPRRLVACEVLDDVDGTDRRFDAVALAWCDDLDHLDRCLDAWGSIAAGSLAGDRAVRRMIASEEIPRGADWLEARWAHGGTKLKHMAVAHRAAHLTPGQFSELWRRRAGSVKQASGEVAAIPADVRGLAYVQNHAAGPSDYDAINEVYFDDLAGLRRRVEWFASELPSGEDDLVGEHVFLAVRETPIG